MMLQAVKFEMGEEYYKAGVRALSWGYDEREIIAALGQAWEKWEKGKGSLVTFLKYQLLGVRARNARENRVMVLGQGRYANTDTREDDITVESLDLAFEDDEGGEHNGHNIHGDDYLAPDNVLMREERELEIELAKQELDRQFAKSGLSEREKLVMLLRAQDESLQAIGDKLGLTRERVRQIEMKARKALNLK